MGKIRIIGGVWGGRRISSPPPGTDVRPMFNRVKESLFNILQKDIEGKRVLDLFAGTGSIGIEALSRGAASVLFVEGDRRNIPVIRENLMSLGAEDRASVMVGQIPEVLRKVKGSFDLVFLDPPFRSNVVFSVLPELLERTLLLADALLVIQRARRNREIAYEGYNVIRRHEVGDSELWFLTVNSDQHAEAYHHE